MNYKDYLRSDHWKKRRQRFIKNTHKRCFICRAKNVVFHVHHKRYTNLGNEKHNDLRLLCEKCHNTVHKHHLEEYLVNGTVKRRILRDWIKRLDK